MTGGGGNANGPGPRATGDWEKLDHVSQILIRILKKLPVSHLGRWRDGGWRHLFETIGGSLKSAEIGRQGSQGRDHGDFNPGN